MITLIHNIFDSNICHNSIEFDLRLVEYHGTPLRWVKMIHLFIRAN